MPSWMDPTSFAPRRVMGEDKGYVSTCEVGAHHDGERGGELGDISERASALSGGGQVRFAADFWAPMPPWPVNTGRHHLRPK